MTPKSNVADAEPTQETTGRRSLKPIEPIVTEIQARDQGGKIVRVPVDSFQMQKLEAIIQRGYREGDALPPAKKHVDDKKGIEVLDEQGDSRFYFQGNELIEVFMARSKRRRVFWLYKDKNPLHRRIRQYMRRKGFPGA